MDDRRAHFAALVGDVSAAARTGGHRMTVQLGDGTTLAGSPMAPRPNGVAELDHTGFIDELQIDETTVRLSAVVCITIAF